MEYSKILCSVCDEKYKIVKRPIKRKLTKWERFEIILFYIAGITFTIGGIIYFLSADIKESKDWESFLIAIVICIVFRLWLESIKRLEKES